MYDLFGAMHFYMRHERAHTKDQHKDHNKDHNKDHDKDHPFIFSFGAHAHAWDDTVVNMMLKQTVLMTGGSGFVGRAVTQALLAQGAQVIWLRHKNTNKPINTQSINTQQDEQLSKAFASVKQVNSLSMLADTPVDVVINLAGASIAAHRWSRAYCDVILRSRVETTLLLTQWMGERASAGKGIAHFISASATGYYGRVDTQILDENAPAGSGFLADVAQAWEHAAQTAPPDTALTILRFATVLGEEGFLSAYQQALRWHIGYLGTGKYAFPYITLEDLVALILWSIVQHKTGIYNACAPVQLDFKTFYLTQKAHMHIRHTFNPPLWAAKALLGARTALITDTAHVIPRHALMEGFW